MLIRRIIGTKSRRNFKPFPRTLYKIDIRISDETEGESDERDMRAVLVATAR